MSPIFCLKRYQKNPAGLVVLLKSSVALCAFSSTEVSRSVDLTEALRIGPNSVSRYAVEKNCARSSLASKPERSTPEAKQHWFEVFLAKQVFIAEALSLHYDQRAEVLQTVDTMERHMLSQSSGPSLAAMRSDEAIPEDRLVDIYRQLEVVPEVIGVRLLASDMIKWKGGEWSGLSTENKLQHLKRLGSTEAEFVSGPLPWPYLPFPEIESELKSAGPNSWIEQTSSAATTLVYIISLHAKKQPPFELNRDSFTAFVRNRLQQREAFIRRSDLLDTAAVALNQEMAARLTAELGTLPPQALEVPKNATEFLENEVMARYHRERVPVSITVGEWRTYFNHQFVRRLPRNSAALFGSLKEMIAIDLEVHQARARGEDQTPQFIEDRRNFLHYQALDLYEKEQLLPKITASEEDLHEYYNRHLNNFSQPVGAHCLVLRFESEEKARDWLVKSRNSVATSLTSDLILEQTETLVSRETPVPGLATLTEVLLHSPDSALFGPATGSQGWIVILKRSAEIQPSPYNAVSSQIRAQLLQDRLDEKELSMANAIVKKFEVKDTIPYSQFGVPETLVKPWK